MTDPLTRKLLDSRLDVVGEVVMKQEITTFWRRRERGRRSSGRDRQCSQQIPEYLEFWFSHATPDELRAVAPISRNIGNNSARRTLNRPPRSRSMAVRSDNPSLGGITTPPGSRAGAARHELGIQSP